jgi:hypothetical protein
LLLNNEICSQHEGPSWPWSYGSWIYNYLCSQWLASCWCFFPGPPVSSTNKTDRHDIAEILLKVALNTIIIINQSFKICSIKLMFEWVDMSIRRVMFQWTSSWSSHTVPVNKSMNSKMFNNVQFQLFMHILNAKNFSEWVSESCLTPTQQLLARTIWDDHDGVRFVQDQHA